MQSQQSKTFQTKQKNDFATLFPELEPLVATDYQLKKLAATMIDKGGESTDSKAISNGLSIFSQFLAHDMTFESHSTFKGRNNVQNYNNDRTINLDLDCLYGQKTQSFFYDADDNAKLLLGQRYKNGENLWYDLMRNNQEKAIIPDARNDENIIVSRMQVMFIEFHNRIVDMLREKEFGGNIFNEARRIVVWHYHWLIIHEYLYKIMDWEIYEDIMDNGCRYFNQPHAMPLEFSGAAFRTGHSQTRQMNQINEWTNKNMFELGSFTTMEDYVDWHFLFNFGDDKCQFAKLIDTKICAAFHDIPFIKSDISAERSLPYLNLRRSVAYGLASGEDVAKRLGFEPIKIEETEKCRMNGTPLWYYILREAEVKGHGGEHLGPVGSTILGECFMTLMRNDDYSYLKIHPKWKPTLGKDVGEFEFTDLVRFVYK